MNHSFQIGAVNQSKCRNCGRPFIDHTSQATCEACGNKAECNVIELSRRNVTYEATEDGMLIANDAGAAEMLLCASCESKENEIKLSEIKHEEADPKRDRIVALTNELEKDIPLDSRAYFNAEIMSIVDIEAKIEAELGARTDASHFKLAELVETRLRGFKQNLFQIKQLEHEVKINLIADQRYLNHLVPKLREEEREKFRDYDVSYTPTAAAPTSTPKTRTSAKDKALESFAKMMNISLEQAKLVLTRSVAATIKCTCSETPGICQVHPK